MSKKFCSIRNNQLTTSYTHGCLFQRNLCFICGVTRSRKPSKHFLCEHSGIYYKHVTHTIIRHRYISSRKRNIFRSYYLRRQQIIFSKLTNRSFRFYRFYQCHVTICVSGSFIPRTSYKYHRKQKTNNYIHRKATKHRTKKTKNDRS